MKNKFRENWFKMVIVLAVILVVSGSGYLMYKAISKLSSKKAKNAQIVQETQQQKDLEVENLKKEVEALKNQKPQIVIKETTTESDKLSQSLMDEILQRTVKITCTSSTVKSQGSGFIGVTSEDSNQWFVFTNSHVAVAGPPEDNNCVVGVPSKPDYSISKNFFGQIVDVSSKYPTIDKAVLEVNGDRGFRNAKDVMPLCEFNGVKIGDKIMLVGYPAFGGSSLTATEGTISGFEETQYGPIYKTSAKIDSGNSGGTAVNITKKCFLGMPTWATQGTFEGLGYIQSWEMISNEN